MGLLTFGPVLDSVIPLPATLKDNQIKMKEQQLMQLQLQNSQQLDNTMTVEQRQLMQETEEGKDNISEVSIMSLPPYVVAGVELGFWKTLGTTANLYGLSLTSSNHAAFLIQLTTLIVPSVQGLMGVPVPKRIWTSIALALSGIYLFTQDMTGAGGSNAADMFTSTNTMALGDALCVVAAGFYATYDLRLFNYGKKVPPLPLIRTKIAVQAMLSCLMVATLGGGLNEIITYVRDISSSTDCFLIGSAVLWSGLIINAIVPFLQVSGQQTVGASRAQVVYASQPLWASILSFTLLGETLGENGLKGGFLFLAAIFLAASAESPDANCNDDNDNCEV
jgi:drug/metabolite transporter (DMT)-like permease